MKKFIGLFVIIAICTSMLFSGTTFANSEGNLIFRETFNEYPTNYQGDFNIKNCSGYYVSEYSDVEKGLMLPLIPREVTYTLNADADSDFSFAFDFEVIGTHFKGSITLTDSNGNSFEPVTFDTTGKIAATRGRSLGGYVPRDEYKNMKNIRVSFDSSTKKYSVFVNERCIVSQAASECELEGLKTVTFKTMSVSEAGYLLLDNIAVTDSAQGEIRRVRVPLNPEVSDSVEPDSLSEGDGIFYYNHFEEDTSVGITKYPNSNIIELQSNSDENKALYFGRSEASISNFYSEITYNSKENYYPYVVYSVDVMYGQSGEFNILTLRDASSDSVGGSYKLVRISGDSVLAGSVLLKSVTAGEWISIACAVDYVNRNYDVYINGELCAEDINFSSSKIQTPVSLRMMVPASAFCDAYVDNVLIYEGKGLREISEEEIQNKYGGVKKAVIYEDINDLIAIDGYSTIDLQTGITYADGKKGMLNVAPYGYDRNSVPVREVAGLFGASVEYDSLTGDVVIDKKIRYNDADNLFEVNGEKLDAGGDIYVAGEKMYVPAVSLLEKGFSKKVSISNEYTDPGVIAFGDTSVKGEEEFFEKINDFARYYRPKQDEIIKNFNEETYAGEHPRVFATKQEIELVAEKIKSDEKIKELYDNFIAKASSGTSYMNTALAYQLTKDKSYAEKAVELTKKHFSYDWSTLSYLDLSQNAQTMAFVYDMIYDGISDEDRKYFEEELKKKAIDETIMWYKGQKGYTGRWINTQHNWNEVCNGGIGACALALMDVYPEECSYLIENIYLSLEYYLDYTFLKSGATFEGPTYYRYGKYFLWPFVRGMQYTVGTDYNLTEVPGFYNSLYYIADMHNNKGILFNYSDSDETATVEADYLYYCMKSGQSDLAKYYVSELFDETKLGPRSILNVMIYADKSMFDNGYNLKNTNVYYENSIDVGVMRENRTDENATYAAFKTLKGYPFKSHEQLDHGTFVFDAMGERWVSDLGKEDYSALSGTGYDIWDQNDDRFRAFRNNAGSHNTVIINYTPENHIAQSIKNESFITRFEENGNEAIGVVDMSGALVEGTKSAKRGFMLTDSGKSLVVKDEIELKSKSGITWQIMTKAQDAVLEDGLIKLILNGKTLIMTYECNKGITASFEKASAGVNLFPTESTNNEFNKVVLKTNGSGKIDITVKFTPTDISGASDISEYTGSIDSWSVADKESTVSENNFEKQIITALKSNGEDVYGFDSDNHKYTVSTIEGEKMPVIDFEYDSEKCTAEMIESADGTTPTIIRLTDKNEPDNMSSYIVEYEVVPRATQIDGQTPVQVKSVSVSEVPQGDYGPYKIIDSNLDTRWSAQGKGQWALFDFGQAEDISAMYMATYKGDARILYFNVSVSENGKDFEMVYDGETSGATTQLERFELGSVKARYVKIEFNNTSTGDWNSPTEVVFVR